MQASGTSPCRSGSKFAYWLRFNTDIPQPNVPNMAGAMLWVVPLQAIIFYASGTL